MSHVLEIRDLTKIFAVEGPSIAAVDNVCFDVKGDEFFTMLGPSGCGKTTTLRMISGLETITSGSIKFDGEDFTKVSSFQRNIGMVFQSYALFPHMSVFENTAYGLRIRRISESEIKKHVTKILTMLGLIDLADRSPPELSGGQQQRVAIARALVYQPGMLLLDEPLANLDAKLRVLMREEIRRLQKELGIMAIYVTHDQEEAMSVSDRIAVFDQGKLKQIGSPLEIYERPQTLFVSDFIGQANFFAAQILNKNGTGARISLDDGNEITLQRLLPVTDEEEDKITEGHDAIMMIRPGNIEIEKSGGPGLAARVKRILFLGTYTRYMVDCAASDEEVFVDSKYHIAGIEEGDEVRLTINEPMATLFYKGNASERRGN